MADTLVIPFIYRTHQYPQMVTLDTLELRIYPLDQNLNIHEFKIKILDFIDPIIKHFIWMGERPFSNIYVDRNPPCLREECNIGPDGVDDEWFIYHVVILLSLHLKKMAAITLRDTDGEFLLIEAAEHLPDWLDPDNSYNRVFIFNGSLHIIPIERMPISSIYMALDELALNPSSSIASPSIQKALSRRIVPFTSNRSSNTTVICDRMRLNEMQVLQKSKVIIPTRLASALKDDPSLISPISRALIEFYSPDQLDFTCYEKSSQSVFPKTFDFDPKNFLIGSEARMVPALVAFPRPIFARLLAHQIDSELTKKLSTYFFIREDDVSSEIGAKLVIGSHLALAKKKIKTLPQANDIVIEPYSGVEDDLGWLDIDLPIMMDDLDSKLSGIALTEKEADVIISKMSSPDDLEQHVSYSSAEPDGNKSQQGSWNSFEPSDDEYCSGSSSDSENVSENSDSMIEREIIEAVANDPDLLMKMIQRIEEFGFQDKGNVLRKLLDESERIIKCSKDGGTLLPVPVQKGIADIDPAKVSEARVPPSRTRFFNRNSSSDIPVDDVDNAAPLDESVYKIHSVKSPDSNVVID